MLAELNSSAEALDLIGLLLVLGCLFAAAVAAWRQAWVATAALVVVAIVSAALLL